MEVVYFIMLESNHYSDFTLDSLTPNLCLTKDKVQDNNEGFEYGVNFF